MKLSQLQLEGKAAEEVDEAEQKRHDSEERAAVEEQLEALQASHDAFRFVVKLLHTSCPLLKQPSRPKVASSGFASRLRASAGAGAAAASNAAVASAAAAQATAAEWGARDVHDLDLVDSDGNLLQLLHPDNRNRRASDLLQQGGVYVLASSSAAALGVPPPAGVQAAITADAAPSSGAGRAKTPPKGGKKGGKGPAKTPSKEPPAGAEEQAPPPAYTPLVFSVPWSNAPEEVPSSAGSVKSGKKLSGGKAGKKKK